MSAARSSSGGVGGSKSAGFVRGSSSEEELTIEALSPEGDGLGAVEKRAVRVAGVLPGERVRVHLARDPRERAELIDWTSDARSSERLTPRCAVFGRCGGCTLQHASAALQERAHVDALRRALPRALHAVPLQYHRAPLAYGYRVRARLAWKRERGELALGFRARTSHDVVDAPSCAVLDPRLDAARAELRALLEVLGGAGEVSLALGEAGRAVASIRPERVPDLQGFRALDALFARGVFAGLALHPPHGTAPTTLGDARPVALGGDGAPLRLAPEGFSQANEALNAALASCVRERAACAGRSVLELFAGAGNLTVRLALDARAVTAVELDRAAVGALRENVAARALTNVKAVESDVVEGALPAGRFDVVVLDPPRTGARAACEAIARAATARSVVYVSCDAATLARDVGALSAAYELVSLDAFEMFPQTPHVELVAALTRARGPRRA